MRTEEIMARLQAKYPTEKEYLQAVREVLECIEDVYNKHPEFENARIIERLVEPDRMFTFRVTWVDDNGDVQTNTGYRVQFNNAIGPYKGGLRFHPSVNPSILKFLGFEQTFKNALTTLPMGGGKGGSDFNPKGKSEGEIMRFCQAFMLELWRNIGPDMDVPAGDIGVGGREIGFLEGMYKKLTREHNGVLTGKGLSFGGSLIRPEATGFGAVYFLQHMLHNHQADLDIKGKTVAVSGFGNVSWGACVKATELGAKVVAISGPDGVIYNPNGMTKEKLDYMLELRATCNDVVAPFAEKFPDAKGCQCRWRSYFRSGNDTERHASQLDRERGGRETPRHHGRHPCFMRQVRHTGGRIHKLCEGRQHRRLHESRRGDACPGHNLSQFYRAVLRDCTLDVYMAGAFLCARHYCL